MNYDRPALRDRLAAEYVLGTLHGGARRRFVRLMRANANIRAAVQAWEAQLMPMAAPLEAPMPPAAVWRGIEARVKPGARTAAAPTTRRESFWERWFGLRTFAPLAAGVVLGLGVMLIAPQLGQQAQQQQAMQLPESYAGILADTQGRASMLVSSLRHGVIVDIKVTRALQVPDDRMLVLWALPRDGAPFALGIVPGSGKGRLTLRDTSEKLLSAVGELAVSIEARSDTPPAAPTEPFALRGPCAKFW